MGEKNVKMRWIALLALIMLLMLGVGGASAEETTTTAIDLVFDGKMYTDTVQVEWTEKYPVPEGGVKWDGTEEFVAFDKSSETDIRIHDDIEYIDGQIIFQTKYTDNFYEIEQIASKYDARIIGYIALTGNYAIELVHDRTYSKMLEVIECLKNEDQVLKDTVIPNIAIRLTPQSIPDDSWEYESSEEMPEDYWHSINTLYANWGAMAIRANRAWDYNAQMHEISIGVIDTSFPARHEDIKYKNIYGNDSFMNDHGTHVAGIAAAMHNKYGISGIHPKGKIVGIGLYKADVTTGSSLNDLFFSTYFTHMCGIIRCINDEARIINISQGYSPFQYGLEVAKLLLVRTSFDKLLNPFFSELEKQNEDFLIICSAGNDDDDVQKQQWYLAIENDYLRDRLVVVGSLGWVQNHASFNEESAWGKGVDILAPGVGIYSCTIPGCEYYDTLTGQDIIRQTEYGRMTGTSMAAPYVTGVAAMIKSIDPSKTGPEIKQILLNHGERIKDSHEYEHPVLDAYACVQDVLGIGSINGIVKAGLNGLEGAEVNISQNGNHVVTLITDRNGQFCSDLPVGEYLLRINEDGYTPIERNIIVSPGHDVTDTFLLEKPPENISVGDYLTLGEYLGEPIVWRCVGIDANGPLMLSDKILCFKAYDVAGNYGVYLRRIHGSNHWETSSLKHWLNSEGTVDWSGRASIPNKASCFDGYNAYDTEAGFLSCFTQEERKLIKFVTQKTYLHHLEKDLAVGGTSALKTGGNSTFAEFTANMSSKTANKWYYNSQEYFFVMGPEQLKMVYDNIGNDYIMAKATAGARNNDESRTTKEDINYMYWLRLPCNEGMNYENIRIVDSTQRIYYGGVRGAVDGEIYHSVGVRPAFYLNVSE